MPNTPDLPNLHPGNAVIAKLYSAVMDNENLSELFSAWDNFVEHVFQQDPEEAKLWQSILSEHFEQAGPLITVSKPSLAEEKQGFVDRQAFPAVLFNTSFRIVAKNDLANRLWAADLDSDISEFALPPFNAQKVLETRKSLEYPDPKLVSIDVGTSEQSQIVMAVIHPVEFTTGDGHSKETLFIMRIAMPRWKPELGRMLATTYALTDTEIEITKCLYENKSLNLIAVQRQRSIRTVRTQLSHIFDKTGASSQTELIGMISNLGQILDLAEVQQSVESNETMSTIQSTDVETKTCYSTEGHLLSYTVYGDKNGKPILSFQPTLPPEMTKPFRTAALNAGLRIIAPYKPGSGQSSSRSYRYTPQIAAHDIKAILNAESLEVVDMLGIYSGGIYALAFANLFPNSVSKIVLADTGVPLKAPHDFTKMSSVARRTFLPARFFPKILLTPHKMVAKEFHASKAGQKRIVNYFFQASPVDSQLVQKDRNYYNITRDMIGYSFEDIKQLVDYVCLWASDWTDMLSKASSSHPLYFFHGEKNDIFMAKAVEKFCKDEPLATARIMEDHGQLGLFVSPDALMEILKS